MTVAFIFMTFAVFVLLVVIGLQAGQIMHLAIQAKDAQIKAARVLAFYQSTMGKSK